MKTPTQLETLIFRKTFVTILCLVVVSTRANAGLHEVLSSAVNVFNPAKCSSSYSEDGALKAISDAATCVNDGSSITAQSRTLGAIATNVTGSAEDRLFGALAEQQILEQGCASNFARAAASGQSEIKQHLLESLNSLREYRQRFMKATEKLYAPGRATTFCPSTLDQLNAQHGESMRADYYDLCKELITTRLAGDAVLNAIPLSDAKDVRKLCVDYAQAKDGAEFDQVSKALDANINKAYGSVARALDDQSASMKTTLQSGGGAGFGSDMRRSLIADPAVNAEVVARLGNADDVKGLMCSADARYGRGAKNLDKALLVGSVGLTVVTLGSSLLPEGALAAGGGLSGLSELSTAARAANVISTNATRVLKVASLGTNALTTFDMAYKSCYGDAPAIRSKRAPGASACVSAPKVEELPQLKCSLAVSLTAIGVAAPILLPKAVRAITGARATAGDEAVASAGAAPSSAPASAESAAAPADSLAQNSIAAANKTPRKMLLDESSAAAPSASTAAKTEAAVKALAGKNPWFKKYMKANGEITDEGKAKARELADKYKSRELDEHRPPEHQHEIDSLRTSIEKDTTELESITDQYAAHPDDPVLKKSILKMSRQVADQQKKLMDAIGKPDNQIVMAAASKDPVIPPRWILRSKRTASDQVGGGSTASAALDSFLKRGDNNFKLNIDPVRLRIIGGQAGFVPKDGLIYRNVVTKTAKIESDSDLLHELDHAAGDLNLAKRQKQIAAHNSREFDLESMLDGGSEVAPERPRRATYLGFFRADPGKSLDLLGYDDFVANDEMRTYARNFAQQDSVRKQKEFIESALGKDAVPPEMQQPQKRFNSYAIRTFTMMEYLDSAAQSITASQSVKPTISAVAEASKAGPVHIMKSGDSLNAVVPIYRDGERLGDYLISFPQADVSSMTKEEMANAVLKKISDTKKQAMQALQKANRRKNPDE